jgi:phosphate acetyltransferase
LLDNAHPIGREDIVTPLMFEHRLLEQARRVNKHIVLPEGTEERILRAAHRLAEQKICRLTLLGDPAAIGQLAAELGLTIDAELRAKKGVTLEQARERVADVSYFGTMMVLEGLADGMVSGSVNTTAHTIRPALEVIKTKPGVSVVSSVFLMCLADRVLVFGDCAVNPNPTPDQVADIAISSAATAKQFGIEPKVAMLSYSTGTSGTGPDVEQTIEATRLVRQRAPGLIVDGPLQYDAAVDAAVARTKLPDSPVAGQATVLIFPDLQTGNNTYKAVQRSAGALAIGPVLQGLNKPVNDLSRGALVADIVNTVAITAIQAGLE